MRPIVITGGTGTLGSAFQRLCLERGLDVRVTRRDELDIANPESVRRALARLRPWLVINTAGYVRVDDAETDHARCHRENTLGPETLARACERDDIQLVSFSSDLVFDGDKTSPYEEHDAAVPLGVYGRTKLEAEQRILAECPGALVIRTSAFFGPWDRHNFVSHVLGELKDRREVHAADDVEVSPTYVPDLVHTTLDLAIDGEHGLWHLANEGVTTWAAFGKLAAETAGHDAAGVTAVPSTDLGWKARRPRFSALATARGASLPPLDDALRRYHLAVTQEFP